MGLVSSAAARVRAHLFAGRFRFVGIVIGVFLAIGLVTRIALAFFNGDWAAFAPQRLVGWLLVGSIFDLGVASFIALPFACMAWLAPDTARGRRLFAPVALSSAVLALCAFLFVAAAEFVFWNEF